MLETKIRTLTKAIILRLIVFTVISLFVYFVYNDPITKGFQIAIFDIFIELFTYYIYERLWGKISWGIISYNTEEDIII